MQNWQMYSPVIALEDLELNSSCCGQCDDKQYVAQNVIGTTTEQVEKRSYADVFKDMGLTDVDIASCGVSDEWKHKMAGLVVKYDSIFSRGKLDCGEPRDFVHRIRLKDERPYRLSYRRKKVSILMLLRKLEGPNKTTAS